MNDTNELRGATELHGATEPQSAPELHEAVELPDPAQQRYVHPVDLPEARGLSLRGWWFGRLASIPVVVAVGALVWAIGGSLFGAAAAALSTFLIGYFVSRWFTKRAWDYIPRKRQDVDREPWAVAAAAIDAVALVVIALAVLLSLQHHPIPDEVVAYSIGAGFGIVVLQLVELLVAIVRGRFAWARVLLIVGVAASVSIVAAFGIRGAWGESLALSAVLGGATIVLVQLGWWGSTALKPRQQGEAAE